MLLIAFARLYCHNPFVFVAYSIMICEGIWIIYIVITLPLVSEHMNKIEILNSVIIILSWILLVINAWDGTFVNSIKAGGILTILIFPYSYILAFLCSLMKRIPYFRKKQNSENVVRLAGRIPRNSEYGIMLTDYD